MNIRTKAQAGLVIAVAVAGIALGGFFVSGRQLARIDRLADAVSALETDALTLQHLTGEYWRRPNSRVRRQWLATAAQLHDGLDAVGGPLVPAPLVEMARGTLADSERLAGRLVVARELADDPSHDDHGLNRELAERLAGQLATRVQVLAREVTELNRTLAHRRDEIRRTERATTLAVMMAMAGLMVLIAVGARRSLADPLVRLNAAVGRIDAKSLDTRVDTGTRDEIGELSRAFDGMTGRLRQTMASRDELEREVEQRRRAEVELSRSNRDLEEFSYSASHDLQEPLRKIIAFSDLVMRRSGNQLDPEDQTHLRRVQNSARRMQDLINSLLEYSRVSTRGGRFGEVDLAGVVAQVKTALELQIEETGARIEVGKLPVLEAEPVQMQQLFQNLLSNALKYRDTEVAPLIRVSASRTEHDGAPAWRIDVADNGIGIDPRYHERIFKVFNRLHPKDVYEGTGIGLALCRKIVDMHGGEITVTGAEGEGSTFSIVLPDRDPES